MTERPTVQARKAIVASVLGYAMDGFDLQILAFALSAISSALALSNTQAGSLATITLIGAVLGGIVFGILSDYFGRVRVLTWSIVFFAVFTGLTAIAQGYLGIAIFRFLAGVGIGGEFGIGMTLAAETWPARLRARATSLVGLGWQAGVLVAALLSAPILGRGAGAVCSRWVRCRRWSRSWSAFAYPNRPTSPSVRPVGNSR